MALSLARPAGIDVGPVMFTSAMQIWQDMAAVLSALPCVCAYRYCIFGTMEILPFPGRMSSHLGTHNLSHSTRKRQNQHIIWPLYDVKGFMWECRLVYWYPWGKLSISFSWSSGYIWKMVNFNYYSLKTCPIFVFFYHSQEYAIKNYSKYIFLKQNTWYLVYNVYLC